MRHPNQRDAASLPRELRRTTVPASVRRWIARHAGHRVDTVRRLPGASSTAVHAVRLDDGTRLVLRRYVWPGFLDDEPVAPTREVDGLRLAATAGLPVPSIVAADPTGEEVGDGVPMLLMTMLSGRAFATPSPAALAELAASVHAVEPIGLEHEYFRWYQATTTGPPPGSTRPELWAEAIELWRAATPAYEPTFIHRDFHPGNVLWSRGRVTGVVDWANACRGPWGCDVATCRGNLIRLGGPDVADAFLRAYESLTGRTYDPYWELARIMEQGSVPAGGSLAEPEGALERAVRSLAARG